MVAGHITYPPFCRLCLPLALGTFPASTWCFLVFPASHEKSNLEPSSVGAFALRGAAIPPHRGEGPGGQSRAELRASHPQILPRNRSWVRRVLPFLSIFEKRN